MKRLALLLVCFVLSTSVNLAAPALKDRKDEDRKRIVGRWVQEAMSMRGEPVKPGQPSVFRFESDGSCGLTQGVPSATETPAQYTIDPTKSPRRMKWLHGERLHEWTCLYQLDGDNLKVAFVDPSVEPPKQIEPSANLTIYYLKRIKD